MHFFRQTETILISQFIIKSYKHHTNQCLLSKLYGSSSVPFDEANASQLLYNAPKPILSHNGYPTATNDPLFVYANLAAQKQFGYTLDEFIGMPSRLSAPPADRQERKEFLVSSRFSGFADGYTGTRIRKDGSLFTLQNTSLWSLMDEDGNVIGQAACIMG
jgi:PAS domain S-box-containing protein